MSKTSLSVVAAIAVTALGALPLLGLFGEADGEPQAVTSIAIDSSPVLAEVNVAKPSPVEPEVITVTEPAPEITELSPAVVGVLHARGFAESAPGAELESELPPSVVNLLIERDVVLTIATEAEDPDAGGGS